MMRSYFFTVLILVSTCAAYAQDDQRYGREVFRTNLREQKQQVVWDTRQTAPGSYTVVLLHAGRQLRTEKLIIRQ